MVGRVFGLWMEWHKNERTRARDVDVDRQNERNEHEEMPWQWKWLLQMCSKFVELQTCTIHAYPAHIPCTFSMGTKVINFDAVSIHLHYSLGSKLNVVFSIKMHVQCVWPDGFRPNRKEMKIELNHNKMWRKHLKHTHTHTSGHINWNNRWKTKTKRKPRRKSRRPKKSQWQQRHWQCNNNNGFER